ncbi:uroporphyrinogen decarboxylase [Shewanella mangrovi]|uniref:Uroporphyrinogen decarboxylase n=1 Tax=Shewanella mangrovi TaxID=1515746 RepID=A0A094JA43_9GAMM|nr:YgjV family protein [Shewanella mangrovi]KFZ36785.1 uroporphyrinogen decarboxylase [Shewanella mangrovi]
MDALNTVELVGYSASLMVAISLMMKDIIWLRWLNFVGCVLFVIYGAAITAWPVAAMNAFVGVVNVIHLVRLYRYKARSSADFDVTKM